jgi:hypothetical protein
MTLALLFAILIAVPALAPVLGRDTRLPELLGQR